MSQVLIYNLGGQEILGAVSFRHAITMISRNVAKVHTAVDGEKFGPFQRPKAVELLRFVHAKWVYARTGTVPFSRSGLKVRDRETCGYCDGFADTVDHIIPRSWGGQNSWENTIMACQPCNGSKANRTPEEAGMPLLRQPYNPTFKDIFEPRIMTSHLQSKESH